MKIGDLYPTLKEDIAMGDNMKLAKQKQDKSPLKGVKKEVKMTDKKDNMKKRETVKDRK
jgi:hypothetical protein